MSDSPKRDKSEPAPADRGRSATAERPGGNPDKRPAANSGNVGLGAADENEAPRKPGSRI
jgi:hypothetical protein